MDGTLEILTPSLEDMGLAANLAMVGRGKVHLNKGGKGSTVWLPLRFGPRHKASTFILEGSAATCGLRFKDADKELQIMHLTMTGEESQR